MNCNSTGPSMGEVMIIGSFRVTPAEAVAHYRARALTEQLSQTGATGGHVVHGGQSATRMHGCAWSGNLGSSAVPSALLIDKALAAMGASPYLRDAKLRVPERARLQTFGCAVIGELISCAATVRFHSRGRGGDQSFLTLRVELRRSRGGTVLRFDVGVELVCGEVDGSNDLLELDAA